MGYTFYSSSSFQLSLKNVRITANLRISDCDRIFEFYQGYTLSKPRPLTPSPKLEIVSEDIVVGRVESTGLFSKVSR